MNHTVAYAGLFDFATNATIKNVTFVNPVVIGQQSASVVAGTSVNTTIKDVHVVNGDLDSNDWQVGMIVAEAYSTNISNCSSTGAVNDRGGRVGGIAGVFYDGGTMADSHSDAEIYSQAFGAGGLVGENNANILRCHATGNVSTDGSFSEGSSIGGIAGFNDGSISDSWASGNVHATATMAGGIAGYNTGLIYNSYASGNVSGGNTIGGLAGFTRGPIVGCHASGTVSGSGNAVGGLIGEMVESTLLRDSYAEGNVSGNNSVGGLVGILDWPTSGSSMNIINCHASGNVSGRASLGGLLGWAQANGLTDSYATGNVQGEIYYGDAIGGLVGYGSLREIARCSASGNVTGQNYLGGLVGNNSRSRITNSTASGNVQSYPNYYSNYAGGLVGYNLKGTVESSNASGNVSGALLTYAGGLIGWHYATGVSGSSASGAVSATNYAGGLIGYGKYGLASGCRASGAASASSYVGGLFGYGGESIIKNSHSSGPVTGTNYTGGLVGAANYTSIIDSYSIGSVAGGNSVGGLAGKFDAPFQKDYGIYGSFAAGSVSGSSATGGLVGNATNAVFNNSYWDVCRTGQRRCTGNLCDVPGCMPENSMEAPGADYFYDYGHAPIGSWDFQSWSASCGGEGYPSLPGESGCGQLENPSCTINPAGGTLGLHYAGGNRTVKKDDFFNVTVNVSCTSGKCGDVAVTLDPALANGTLAGAYAYPPYYLYAYFISGTDVPLSSSYYIAMKNGSLQGGCYQIGYGYCYYYGIYYCGMYIYDPAAFGITAGNQFEIWATLPECQGSFVHLINSVSLSAVPAALNQNISCTANTSETVTQVNFTITDPYFITQLDQAPGTKVGDLWVSPAFSTGNRRGIWNCTAVASDGSMAQNASTGFSPGIKGAVPTGSGTPFYTAGQNPFNAATTDCLSGMEAGDSCLLNWAVNATGDYGTWEFYAVGQSDAECVAQNESEHFYVKISNRTTKGVIPMDSGNPFYATTPNPLGWKGAPCLKMMGDGDSCAVSWWVMATGPVGSTWDFFTQADSSSWTVPSAESEHFEVTITELSIDTPPTVTYIPPTPDDGATVLAPATIRVGVNENATGCTLHYDSEAVGMAVNNADADTTAEASISVFGTHVYNVTCYDSVGQPGSTGPRAVTIDKPPAVEYIPPTPDDGATVPSAIISVSVDENATDCTLFYSSTGDGSQSAQMAVSNADAGTAATVPLGVPGTYTYYAVCHDSLGQPGSTDSRTVTIDPPPVVAYIPPTPDDGATVPSAIIAVSVDEDAADCTLFYSTGTGYSSNQGAMPMAVQNAGAETTANAGITAPGTYRYYVLCHDYIGQPGSTESRNVTIPEPGEEPPEPLRISFSTSCDGNVVVITSDGQPVSGVKVTVGDISYATESDGTVEFQGCGKTLPVRASREDYAVAQKRVTLISCEECAVPVQPPVTPPTPPSCTPPSCCGSDDDCADTYKCIREAGADFGRCVEITGCGLVANHTLTPWECGGAGCPACAAGSSCITHTCVKQNVTQPPLIKPPVVEPPVTQVVSDNTLPFLLILLLLLLAVVLYVRRKKKKPDEAAAAKRSARAAKPPHGAHRE